MKKFLLQHWQSMLPLALCCGIAIAVATSISTFEELLPQLELGPAENASKGLPQFGKMLRRTGAFALFGGSFIALELFTIAVSAFVIYRSLTHCTPQQRNRLIGGTLFAGLVLIAVLSPTFVNLKSYTFETIAFIGENIGPSPIKATLVAGNLLLCFTVWVAAVACGAILTRSDEDKRPEELVLQNRMELSRLMLFTLAVLLVAGTLSIHSLFALPTVWMSEAKSDEMYEVARSISIIAGAIGSLFLVCIYVPTQLLLYQRASGLASERYRDDDAAHASEWLATKGLTTSYGEQLPSMLAVFGPILAGGPLEQLLTSLIG